MTASNRLAFLRTLTKDRNPLLLRYWQTTSNRDMLFGVGKGALVTHLAKALNLDRLPYDYPI
jgi:hypothetical protein